MLSNKIREFQKFFLHPPERLNPEHSGGLAKKERKKEENPKQTNEVIY